MTDVFLAFQGSAPANTNKTWNNVQTGSSSLGLNTAAGSSSGLSLTAANVAGAIEIAVDVNSLPTADAAWVDELPIARWGHYKNSSTEWASYTITGGTPNAAVTYYSFCSAGFGRLTEVRVNGGTSQTQDSNVNKTEVLVFNTTFDGSGNLVIEHRQGDGSSGSAYQNAGWLSYGSAADITPPTWDSAPAVTNTTESGHTIGFTANEAGTVYGIRLANGATAPDSAQVVSGTDASDSAAPEVKSVTVAAGVANSFTFSTGSAGTAYDYYIVAEDDEGTPNVQASPTLVEATTDAAVVEGISAQTIRDKAGDLTPSATNLKIAVRASSDPESTVHYSTTTGSLNGSSQTAAINLESAGVSVGDTVHFSYFNPALNEGLNVDLTVEDIA